MADTAMENHDFRFLFQGARLFVRYKRGFFMGKLIISMVIFNAMLNYQRVSEALWPDDTVL